MERRTETEADGEEDGCRQEGRPAQGHMERKANRQRHMERRADRQGCKEI